MKVGIPKETHPGEKRVAGTPASIMNLLKAGVEVQVEEGAGVAAGFPDQEYTKKGAQIVSRAVCFAADAVFQVRVGLDQISQFRTGQVVIGFADPLGDAEAIRSFARTGVTLLAMELIPRTTRAQSMDALSSQANLAGYQAVLWAACRLPKIFPMMTTAAGGIKPAKVLVLGAGVAGLQAIATARRLGAVVSAFDVRPVVKEQVQSLGARFVELPVAAAEGQGGYAREQSADEQKRQQELLGKVIAEHDVVISTAAIPGKRSPILITKTATESMRLGSVVVDLAAERGGNCEVSVADQIVEHMGVTVYGPTNLASEVAFDASQTYGNNVAKLFALMLTKEGALAADVADDIVIGSTVCKGGEIVHPQVKAALAPAPNAAVPAAAG